MLATIQLSPYIFVQGEILRRLPDGAVAIEAAGREYVGAPLASAAARPAPVTPVRAVEPA